MIGLVVLIAGVAAGDGGLDRVQVTVGTPAASAASFAIAPAGREGAWHASTPDGCRFGLEIASGKGTFSKGAFLREKGASCAKFLSRVAAALEAKEVPKAKPADRVDFGLAVLGADLRREPGGGFSGKGGGWTATKVFLDDGAAEVYLNFNPRSREAESSIKDPDYGEDVLRALASVM